jgi:Zn-finger nucleic acid-binding protein
MLCPTCNSSLLIVEYKQIELDYCTRCHGVWFDANELDLLVKTMEIEGAGDKYAEIFKLPDAQVNEALRKCPACRKQMKKAYLGEAPKILVDVCRRNDGMWFDGGEVAQLIKNAAKSSGKGTASGNRIVDFLGEVFQIEMTTK